MTTAAPGRVFEHCHGVQSKVKNALVVLKEWANRTGLRTAFKRPKTVLEAFGI